MMMMMMMMKRQNRRLSGPPPAPVRFRLRDIQRAIDVLCELRGSRYGIVLAIGKGDVISELKFHRKDRNLSETRVVDEG
jgi:hypothetical protein